MRVRLLSVAVLCAAMSALSSAQAIPEVKLASTTAVHYCAGADYGKFVKRLGAILRAWTPPGSLAQR